MICSVRFTFGFEESALNTRTVIKIIPIMINTNVTNFRKQIFELIDQIAKYNEP